MRKNVLLYSFIFLLICALSSQTLTAQKVFPAKHATTLNVDRNSPAAETRTPDKWDWENPAKAACDTLNYYQYQNTWTIVDYSITAVPQYSSGFVNGANVDGDKAKATYFANSGGNTYVLGCLIAFARAYSSNPSKLITIKVWNVSAGNPGTELATKTLTMQQVMTDVTGGYFTNVKFDNPVNVGGQPFYVGVDFSNLDWTSLHDTLSIQSNQDPETSPSAVWEYQSSNTWYHYTAVGSYNLSISLAILPFMSNVPADAAFTQSTVSTCSGYPVTYNASTSVQNSVQWVLQGATPSTSTQLIPTVTYAAAGTYPVKLRVWGGSCNNKDSLVGSITIIASPLPGATATPPAICIGNSTTLNASNGQFYQWTGYPPGPGSSQVVSPSSNTTYTVTVTGSNGCSASQNVLVTVHQLPDPNPIANPAWICVGNSALLTATAGMSSYLWSPGANTTAAYLVSPITTTIYTVTVIDANTCTNSDTVTVTVDPCIGINEAAEGNAFSITPNPSNGLISLQMADGADEDMIRVYNPAGQLVFSKANLQTYMQLDLTGLPKGIYYVRLESDAAIFVRKLVIQ